MKKIYLSIFVLVCFFIQNIYSQQCRNTGGNSPQQPATIYIGDDGTFGHQSWATHNGNWPQWQIYIHTSSDIHNGTAGSLSDFSSIENKTSISPRFTSTGTWYWGMKVLYSTYHRWYCRNDSNWHNMWETPTSDLTITVLPLENPSNPISITTVSDSQLTLNWTKWNSKNVMIVRRLTSAAISSAPIAGTAYSVGAQLGTGTVVYNSNGTSFTDTNLSPGESYTYTLYSENYSYYSSGVTPTGVTSVTWNGTSWSNTSGPTNSIDAIINGDLPTSADLACKNLTINSGKTLTVSSGNSLKVAGNLVNNGSIVFKSDASGSGIFDSFTGAISGTGSVTVERFIPANKRSFRFLSSAVTTSTSIKANWQENVSNTTTVYADNQNPNSGYGTHITGAGGATNGFDTTTTNNPSLYSYTNGAWAAVVNTNSSFTAGTPYRLLVRGDRSINMSTNTPTPTNTTLRATGTLHTGNFTPALNQAASGYSFVGNPYQAPIDIKAALNASTNMDKTKVYYWDPTLNTRGAYVTRTLSSNSNNVSSSFNQYLQPGQAVFVQNTSAGSPTMTITESHKSLNNAAAGVFRTTNTSDFGLLRVHLQANTNNQWNTIEGTLAVFNNMYSWNTTEEDAVKFANLDEEVSLMQDNTSLAIAMQTNPSSTNELPIRLKNTRHTAYQWKFELSDYNGLTPYLVDTQNSTYTPIENNTVVPFTVNGQELNRFKIVFQNSALSVDDFANNIKLYPNPAKAGASFYIDGIAEATVSVYNVLGQNIPVQLKSQGYAIQVTPTQTLSQGIYLVTVTTEGKTQHIKWIVE
jgi:hypothetical protein